MAVKIFFQQIGAKSINFRKGRFFTEFCCKHRPEIRKNKLKEWQILISGFFHNTSSPSCNLSTCSEEGETEHGEVEAVFKYKVSEGNKGRFDAEGQGELF
jgi:hypothetical protein